MRKLRKASQMVQNLIPLAPQIYLFPKHDAPDIIQPNVGLIQAGNQTILIDSGNSPNHAREILRAAAHAGLPAIRTIILTHHHWDHSFGAATIQAEHIIAHHITRQHLLEYQHRTWNTGTLREEMQANPAFQARNQALLQAIRDWREFSIARLTVTFSTRMALYRDHMHIELEHIGGRHAADSIVVKLPEQRVMFVGDCYYPPPFHLRKADDVDLDTTMLDRLLGEEYDWYIDGHGTPYSRAAFAAMLQQEISRQQAGGQANA